MSLDRKIFFKYFGISIIWAFLGLCVGSVVGYQYSGTMQGALSAFWIVLLLAVLEVSISFDNAVVNAGVLKKMTPLWQHRFLTWGMLIAVFGMRLIFPLVIVAVVSHTGPWAALMMAAFQPSEYAQVMLSAHHQVVAFGGSFLMLVALS